MGLIPNQKIRIVVNNQSLLHYQKLGYNVKIGGVIFPPPEDLTYGCTKLVKVKCDRKGCGTEKELPHRKHIQNTNNHTRPYTCSINCANKLGKVKQTKLERYGDENYNNTKKNKQTKLENHGDENYNNRDQMKKTMEGRWDGVVKNRNETIKNRSDEEKQEIVDKCEKTKMDLYGDPYYSKVEKSKETWANKSDEERQEIQDKFKQTCLENLGVEHPLQSEKIVSKIKETKKLKYGDPNYNNREKMIETFTGLSYEKYIEQSPKYKRYKNKVHNFTKKQPLYLLNNIEKRSLHDHQLDHMYSITQGFKDDIESEIISNIINLEMITQYENGTKNKKCSLTKEELFDRYDRRDEILNQLTEDYNKRKHVEVVN